jgi:hypothetical protein
MRLVFTLLALVVIQQLSAQARLTIKNDSERKLSVKIMKHSYTPTLFDSITVAPNSEGTLEFSQTGTYFAKSMATMEKADSIYQKTRSFRLVTGPRGSTVMTLTFTIKESSEALTGNVRISRKEWEQN